MNCITLLSVLLIAVISTTDAQWGWGGWGGRGFGWGGGGGGLGGWGLGGWGYGGLGGSGYPGFIGKRLAEERRVECLLATKTSINCNR